MTLCYRKEIDGLRCLAVMAVIFYHAGFGFFTGGFIGVDVFFVLSGYLITGIVYREVTLERFSILTFYERRVRRIFPALYIVLFMTVLCALLWLSPKQFQDFSQSLLATSSFLSNVYFWLKLDYFAGDTELAPLLHTWSLSVEEQFYIVFPFLLLLLKKRNLVSTNTVLITIATISLLLSISIQDSHPKQNFYSPVTRAWELLLGALIALNDKAFTDFSTKRRVASEFLAVLGVTAILTSIYWLDSKSTFPGYNAILPVFGSALFVAFAREGSRVAQLFSLKPMVGIGLISYSAYLIHQPLFVFARLLSDTHLSLAVYCLLIIFTLVLAAFSWRVVEQPFRNKNWLSRIQVLTLGAIVLIVFCALGVLGHLKQGFPARFSQYQNEVLLTTKSSPTRATCHTEGKHYLTPHDACVLNQGDLNWAVIGDSHGIEFAYELSKSLESKDRSILHLTFSGCGPSYTLPNSNLGCHEWTVDAVNYILETPSIQNVILVYRHTSYIEGENNVHYKQYDEEEFSTLYFNSLGSMVDLFVEQGRNVYLMAPVPELSKHIDQFIFNVGLSDRNRIKQESLLLSDYMAENKLVLGQLKKIADKQGDKVTLVPSWKAFCDEKQCRAIEKSKALYFDNNHPSLEGAKRLSVLFEFEL